MPDTFADIPVTEDNRFTHAAASRAVETPFTLYNPLTLTGDDRDELLSIMANEYRQRYPDLAVYEADARTLVGATARSADVLLVHGIDSLDGNMLRLVGALCGFLLADGKQVVLTSEDVPPKSDIVLGGQLRQYEFGLIA